MKRDHEDQIAAARRDKPTDWMRLGNCVGVDVALFFPAQGDMAAIREARRVCAGCSVRAACLDYSNSYPIEPDGVWGGLSADERKRVRMGQPVRAVRT